jgi:hypothetical protein
LPSAGETVLRLAGVTPNSDVVRAIPVLNRLRNRPRSRECVVADAVIVYPSLLPNSLLSGKRTLANAVAQALAPLGVKVTSLPLNPNKIRRLLRETGH